MKLTTVRRGFSLATVLAALTVLIALSLTGYYQHMSPGSLRDRATDAELRLQLAELDRAILRWYYGHPVYENGEFVYQLPQEIDLTAAVTRGDAAGEYGSWLYNAGMSNMVTKALGTSASEITYTRVSDSEYTLTVISQEDTSVTLSSPMSGIDLEE